VVCLIWGFRTGMQSHCEWKRAANLGTQLKWALITHLRGEAYFSILTFLKISARRDKVQSLLHCLDDDPSDVFPKPDKSIILSEHLASTVRSALDCFMAPA
jgi:hypothetical protein